MANILNIWDETQQQYIGIPAITGSSGVHYGKEAPVDPNIKVWVNPEAEDIDSKDILNSLGAQPKHEAITITLVMDNWIDNQQSVEVLGVTKNNTILVGANPDSYTDYMTANIRAISQDNELITFECSSVPATNILINIIIFN